MNDTIPSPCAVRELVRERLSGALVSMSLHARSEYDGYGRDVAYDAVIHWREEGFEPVGARDALHSASVRKQGDGWRVELRDGRYGLTPLGANKGLHGRARALVLNARLFGSATLLDGQCEEQEAS